MLATTLTHTFEAGLAHANGGLSRHIALDLLPLKNIIFIC